MPCNPVWGCFLLGDFPWNRDGNADCVTWNHNNGGGGHSGAIENQVRQVELRWDGRKQSTMLSHQC